MYSNSSLIPYIDVAQGHVLDGLGKEYLGVIRWPSETDVAYRERLLREIEYPSIENVCHHEWIEYSGFTDNYHYCKMCDAKPDCTLVKYRNNSAIDELFEVLVEPEHNNGYYILIPSGIPMSLVDQESFQAHESAVIRITP